MRGPVLELDGVAFIRDRRPILADIDWRVATGERWVVLGPNGAGKSTLLRLASTYELPTRGRVHVLGNRVGRVDLRELRTEIGFVSASLGRAVAAGSSVRDAVVTGRDATLRRWRQQYRPEDWERADRLLAEFGCAHVADHDFRTTSEGERQRIQIARALMAEPHLLLLDEPSASLDLGGREQLVAALTRLAAAPDVPGIVFVTHHVEEIPAGFTHALLLRGGRTHAAGPIDDVMTAENLSSCFDVPVRLERVEGRYTAVARATETV